MGSLILKLFNAPRRIEDIGMGKYMARVLKHFGVAPDTRFMFVKMAKSLMNPVSSSVQNLSGNLQPVSQRIYLYRMKLMYYTCPPTTLLV